MPQSHLSRTCNLGGGGDLCVISGIGTLFGCDDPQTQDLFRCERFVNVGVHPPLAYSFNVLNGDMSIGTPSAQT